MRGTVFGVVAKIVTQNVEKQARATYERTLPLWPRYVDDTFTAVHKGEIDYLQIERPHAVYEGDRGNGKIPFLDCLTETKTD